MKGLNKKLFWDIDFKSLDNEKHADFIIKRVLVSGDVGDYEFIKKQYGLDRIKSVAKKIDFPDKKSLNFWSLIFNIPQELFLCIKKSSTKKQSMFFKR